MKKNAGKLAILLGAANLPSYELGKYMASDTNSLNQMFYSLLSTFGGKLFDKENGSLIVCTMWNPT